MITWYMLVLLSRFEIIWQAIKVGISLVQDDVIVKKWPYLSHCWCLSIFWAAGRGVHLGRQRRLSRTAQPRGLCESTGRIRRHTRETPCSSRFRAAKGENDKGGEYYVYRRIRPFKRPEEDCRSKSKRRVQSNNLSVNQSRSQEVSKLITQVSQLSLSSQSVSQLVNQMVCYSSSQSNNRSINQSITVSH